MALSPVSYSVVKLQMDLIVAIMERWNDYSNQNLSSNIWHLCNHNYPLKEYSTDLALH